MIGKLIDLTNLIDRLMAEKVSIGYWQMRGRGQVPRLLLAYTGAIWEDIQYNAKDQWFEGDKKSLGLTFPNLPYLIEGDFTLSETDALIRYIVERSDKKELLGKTVRDRAVVNNLVGIINEMTALIGALPYDKDY